MKEIKTVVYQTDDGKTFGEKTLARKHEIILLLSDIINTYGSASAGEEAGFICEILEESVAARQLITEYCELCETDRKGKDLHTRYCCVNCGCKYGDSGDCTVCSRVKIQERKCTGECFLW